MIVWRISEFADLSGIGGVKFPGRWNSAGHPIVYTAEHPALALCEMLVHFDTEDMPERFQLLQIEIQDEQIEDVRIDIGLDWRWRHIPYTTKSLGDDWLKSKSSPALKVPSALLPYANNYLLNPAHEDSEKWKIIDVSQVLLDPRFR